MRQVLAATTGALLMFAGDAAAMDADYVIKQTSLDVADAVTRIEAAIEKAPPRLMAKFDHGANAANAGLELEDTVVLVLGAPPVGTPIMQANRLAGLDLPAKIIIYAEGGQTKIAYLKPEALAQRHGLDGAAEQQITQMAKALDGLSGAGVE